MFGIKSFLILMARIYLSCAQCAQSGKNYKMWDFGLKLLIKTSKGSAIKF